MSLHLLFHKLRAKFKEGAPLPSPVLFRTLRDYDIGGAISVCNDYVAAWEDGALVVGFPDDDFASYESQQIFATAFEEVEWVLVPEGGQSC